MTPLRNLSIAYQSPGVLSANPRNARRHSPKQVAQIAASIEQFGFTNPVLVDENNVIIAGHGRLAAAVKLHSEQIATITLAGLTETQKRG